MQYQTKKGFLNEGTYVARGSRIDVEGERAKELLRSGLIVEAEGKQARMPENKAAPRQDTQAERPSAARKATKTAKKAR